MPVARPTPPSARPPRAPRSALAVLAAAALLVGCGTPADPDTDPGPDPALTATPSVAFRVDDPSGVAGVVYGRLDAPFERPVAVGALAADPVGSRDGFRDAALDASGRVTATLIAVVDVPRVNFQEGQFDFWNPPEGCTVTAVNATGAALLPIRDLLLWDGATLDPNGAPAFDRDLDMSLETLVVDGDVETTTEETYLLVASLEPWSAATTTPCFAEDEFYREELDLDLDVVVGWQWLHVVERRTYDVVTGTGTYLGTYRTLDLDEVAALATPIGRTRDATPSAAPSAAGR